MPSLTHRKRFTIIMNALTEEGEANIDPIVWVKECNRGGLNIAPLKITMQKEYKILRQKQYLLSIASHIGLKLIILGLVKDGLLKPCMSPFNAPILPVQKTDGSYRLVQDLRKINDIVRKQYPVVLNSYTLMRKIPHEHCWFSIIDFKDAFWAYL